MKINRYDFPTSAESQRAYVLFAFLNLGEVSISNNLTNGRKMIQRLFQQMSACPLSTGKLRMGAGGELKMSEVEWIGFEPVCTHPMSVKCKKKHMQTETLARKTLAKSQPSMCAAVEKK